MKIFNLYSAKDMEHLGKSLAHFCKQPVIIYLQGELGAGKTVFSRGFIRGLGYSGLVKSPTYTLVEPYVLPSVSCYHFDLYRLSSAEELEAIGVREYFEGQAYSLIEWPENGEGFIPKPMLTVNIEVHGEFRRVQLFPHCGVAEDAIATLS